MSVLYAESLRAFLRPVLPFLDDDSVSEILVNGPEEVWIERNGRLERTQAKFSQEGLTGAIRNIAQFVGRTLTDERPQLDARLPDGSRIHAVLSPISRGGTLLAIRKFFRDNPRMETLLSLGALNRPMAKLLEAVIALKLNLVISGGTGSGKTTFLNILATLVPDNERVLTIEDSAELQLQKSHLISLESRPPDKHGKGGVDMGDLLQSALRLRPDRIVVGEVRGSECFHLIQAMNTGHGGALSTCHANGPTDALHRLESLYLMSGIQLPLLAVRAQISSALQLVICCERLSDGSRKVTRISEVLPLGEQGELRTQDLFVFTPLGKDHDRKVLGYHAPTGLLPRFLSRARAQGFTELNEAFFDPSTYQVPPPPVFPELEQTAPRWAPSLKHREHGEADISDWTLDRHALLANLQGQASTAKAEALKRARNTREPQEQEIKSLPPRPAEIRHEPTVQLSPDLKAEADAQRKLHNEDPTRIKSTPKGPASK